MEKEITNQSVETTAASLEVENKNQIDTSTTAKNSEFEITNQSATPTTAKNLDSECKKQKRKWKTIKISPATITKTAMLTAISFLLYAFGKFNLPMMFPSFLEIQFSELPALLAGFSMGPVSGCIV
ncbi:MAG TPA: ECF transporter S component, partial [Clostridia bacterium]|nr:ECF transporter S component [Clostridia bacterium]